MAKIVGHIKETIREWWKPVTIVMLSAILLFFNAAANNRTQNKLERVATETHSALCTFAQDMERRYGETREYLHDHPGKEPFPGITRASLRRSLANQKAVLDALDVLRCV